MLKIAILNAMIDTHNHSLPYIDDGAIDMPMALAMLKVAEQDGITDVVLTPHHLNGVFKNTKIEVKTAVNELQKEANESGIQIKLHLGSEVHLTHETVDHLVNRKALSYADKGKAALIELPKHSIPAGADIIFQKLIENGITPIIAHPERNSSIREDLSILEKFIQMGCKSQLTAMSCTGDFGPDLQKVAKEMITRGLVHIIASDAHRPDSRPPVLSKVKLWVEKEFGVKQAQILLLDNPSRLLAKKDLINLSNDKKNNNLTSFFSIFK